MFVLFLVAVFCCFVCVCVCCCCLRFSVSLSLLIYLFILLRCRVICTKKIFVLYSYVKKVFSWAVPIALFSVDQLQLHFTNVQSCLGNARSAALNSGVHQRSPKRFYICSTFVIETFSRPTKPADCGFTSPIFHFLCRYSRGKLNKF